ncbi:MAG TPA: L,D-transpeptidase family protein [Candidatus Binatia bacterium]|nr:L,D-transpeptidase family protein [Candidatus Binatia bacterium]
MRRLLRFSGTAEWRARLLFVSIALLFFLGLKLASPGESRSPARATADKPVTLQPETQAWLHATIDEGKFPELRWPDFGDYSKHVNKFYEFNGYALWWTRAQEPTPQAQQFITLLEHPEQKGLSPEDYDGPRWRERLSKLKPLTQQSTELDAAQFDLALTVCAMRYISDLHIGKVNPKRVAFFIDDEPKKLDLPEFLKDHVVNVPDLSAALAHVEPPYPVYHRTIQALQNYIEFAKEDDGEQLPPVKKAIAPGQPYSGTPRLARLLRLLGDLPSEAKVSPDSTIYDGALVGAVRNFQHRFGREPGGLIDAQTVADLNVPLSRRVRQMQLMLERLRWLPSSYQEAPIVVNIPEFRLRGYDKTFNVGVTMKVVVGKALGHDTPVFTDTMQYVVFRPYWEVPPSITRAELIPHIVRDPDYLAQKDFEVVDHHENVVSAGRASSEVIDGLRAGTLSIRQRPGPKNSLGLAKFVFPNSYNVYMHDTPATEFFARSRRDFSHGCVRLENPAELAAWVLRDNPGWNPDRIRAAMNGSTTQQVRLAHPIPVLIAYGTVIVLEDGLVHFYDDIYGHDAALEKALAKGYPYPW